MRIIPSTESTHFFFIELNDKELERLLEMAKFRQSTPVYVLENILESILSLFKPT